MSELLCGLGLEAHVETFERHGVRWEDVSALTPSDLAEMGLGVAALWDCSSCNSSSPMQSTKEHHCGTQGTKVAACVSTRRL